jgi:hypothetical protein
MTQAKPPAKPPSHSIVIVRGKPVLVDRVLRAVRDVELSENMRAAEAEEKFACHQDWLRAKWAKVKRRGSVPLPLPS